MQPLLPNPSAEMVESTPLPNEDEIGPGPSPDSADSIPPGGQSTAEPWWRPQSWFSLDALCWYLLTVLVVVTFAPARSVLQGIGGKNQAWGKYQGQTPEEIDWNVLSELDLFDHSKTARLAALDGQMVVLPGYLIPLDDDFERATEFLLVPYFGACTHVPPPPENQMVLVRFQEKIDLNPYGWDPVWVAGRLHIGDSEMAFGSAAFQMEGFGARGYSPAESRQE